jgi:hypothetical protein
LSINQASGQIILKTNDNGRSLYKEIEGADFPKQFATYRDLYYNYRFGETTEVILQSILRQNQQIDGKQVTGEQVFKDNYNAMHVALLNDLITRRNNARNIAEKRLYNVLFYIVRKEFDTVHKFIK